MTNENVYVPNRPAIEEILKEFEQVSLKDLPKGYLSQAQLSNKKYAAMVEDMRFYKITKQDCYKRIMGDFRIKDFLSRDKKYYNASYYSDDVLYWGIKKEILFKLADLKTILEKGGYNFDAISITSGHRTPQKNKAVGGASKSRHIVGEAIDMHIGDIDRSGFYTEEDKQIVLDICDKILIGDKGGVGKYPGTRVIHIDVRGHRARWNTY